MRSIYCHVNMSVCLMHSQTSIAAQGPAVRVRVISILGRQSCGKSSMLNTMFGCTLPNGAGQVTRGVYMQLVPAADPSSSGCDYLLILDTGGPAVRAAS